MKNLKISQITPLAGYVLVEPAKAEEKTASGIILPGSEGEKPQYGTVLAVGETDDCGCGGECGCGDHCDCGHEHEAAEKKESKHEHEACDCDDCGCGETPVQVGDQVIYKKWGGNEVMIDDVEYQFLKFDDILAVIKKK
jgi:chaperonin GroES